MKGQGKVFVCLSIICVLLSHRCDAVGSEQPIVSKVGGGDCESNMDCSNNGICEATEDAEKAVCLCQNGFKGPNCEEKTAKVAGEEIKPEEDSNNVYDIKESKVSQRSTLGGAAKKTDILEYDQESNVLGLDPKVLADADQPFLIYSPKEKKYLYMSHDIVVFGKHNTHLEARSGRDGKRNLFKLKETIKDSGKYNLFNIETKKYIYVASSTTGVFKWASNNVLGSDIEPDKQNHPKKFDFTFDGNDDGFYRIKNDDKALFVAIFRSGIPSHNIIEADSQDRNRDQTNLFQLVLKEKAKVTVEYLTKDMVKEKATDINCAQHKYVNDGGDSMSSTVVFDKTFTSTTSYSKTVGYTITGSFTAGITALEVLKLGATITAARSSTEQTTDTTQVAEKFTQSFTVTTPGKKISCVVILIDRADYMIPLVMTATTKQGKELIARGKYYGSHHMNTHVTKEELDYELKKECSFEK